MEKKPLILNGWNVLEQGVTFKRKQQNFSIFSTWQHNTGQSPQNRSISQVQGWIKWPEVCVISVFWFFLFSNLIWQSDDGCLFTSSFCFSAYLARGDICEQTRENRSSVQSLSCVQLFAIPWTIARQLLCPSPTPRACSNSCPSNWWCHPTISSSVVPFSSCPQSFPASGSFPVSQLFASGGQSTGVSASASFLPKKSQGWSPSEWTGWISLQSKGLSAILQYKIKSLKEVSQVQMVL